MRSLVRRMLLIVSWTSAATVCSGLDSERLLRADLRFQVRRGRRRAGGGGGRGGGGRRR